MLQLAKHPKYIGVFRNSRGVQIILLGELLLKWYSFMFWMKGEERRGEQRRVERGKRRRKEPEYAKYKGGKRKFMVPLYFPASLKRGLGCFCCGSVVRTESPTLPFSQASQKEKKSRGRKKKPYIHVCTLLRSIY